MTATDTRADVLTDEMLARFDQRAPLYDRENRFFTEDFEELRAAGYLATSLPTEFGGAGLTLAEINRMQRRIAYVAPATAIAVNMHHYFVGLCADLHRAGDTSGDWVLERAAEGHVFAAGHGEAGNDIPVLLSSSKAERVDGGWEFTGHKIFGSLSPVWTYLGVHAMDTSDPAAPKIVHGFIHRDSRNYRIEETWDTLGMRATMSNDTILDRTFVPDDATILVCPAGFAGAGPFQVSLFAWALLGFAGVYSAIAQRAFDETITRMHERGSVAFDPIDGVSPRGATHHRRDAHPPRGNECPPRPCLRRLVRWGGLRNGLAGEDRRLQVRRGQSGVVRRRLGVGPHRWKRHLQAQPLRATVPRRPTRPHPPRELDADARARRQVEPWHQSGRTAALGVTGTTICAGR